MSYFLRRTFIALSLIAFSAKLQAAALTCLTLPELMRAYLVSHVVTHNLNDDVKKQAIDQYVKSLDGFKILLLQEDVKKIKGDLKNIFDTMRVGNCAVLDNVQGIIVQRASEMEAAARKFLDKDYKLDETVEFTLDPDKRDYPKTAAERDAFLKKYIHFQISNYLLSDTKLPEAKNNLIHRYELITKRLKEKNNEKLIADFTKSFALMLDPHSSYFTKDDLEDFQIDMRLSLEGIGASLSSQDGYTTVEDVIPGGAADRAKVLLPKDKILAVRQDNEKKAVSVVDMDLRDVVKLIRGKKKSKVHLSILRKSEQLEVAIVRDKVDLKEQEAKITFETQKQGTKKLKLGIIELPSFYGDGERGKKSSYTDMEKLLTKAKKEKVDGILLNLSRNGGGLLEDAVRISGLFIKKGGVVATQNSKKNVEVLADEDESIAYSGPLVVLTSRLSASASEILAGALKDYKRAVIVGADHTFGKGTVQAVIPLPRDLGAMKVTTGLFFLPGGVSTQHQGVVGDVIIPSPLNNDEIGEKAFDNSLPPQKINAFVGTDANSSTKSGAFVTVNESLVKNLADQSRERITKEKKFTEILSEIEETKKNKGVINLAEIRKKTEADKKKNKGSEKKSNAQRIRDADAPIIKESLNILVDLINTENTLSKAGKIESAKKD